MKTKFFTLTLLAMLAAVTMNAQSLNGTWKAGEELTQLLGSEDESNPVKAMFITIDGNKMDWCFQGEMSDETLGDVVFQIVFPSTFQRDGNKISDMKMQKDKAAFKVVKCGAGDAMAKLLENVLNEQLKKSDNNAFEGIEEMASALAEGTLIIETLTDTKLKMYAEDDEDKQVLSFDRQ